MSESVTFHGSIAENGGIKFDDDGGVLKINVPESELPTFIRAVAYRGADITCTLEIEGGDEEVEQ